MAELQGNDLFRSGIVSKPPSFDELFHLVRSKPLINRYFKAAGIDSVAAMVAKFARKEDNGNMLLKIGDIYKQIVRDTKLAVNDSYDDLLSNKQLSLALMIQALMGGPDDVVRLSQ